MSLLTLAAKAASEVWYDNMAVTSIWRIQGSFNQVVRYVKNPEKTSMPGTAESTAVWSLSDVLRYATRARRRRPI